MISRPLPIKKTREQYEFKIAGFAKASCRKCHGTGRLGYENNESGRVQPCTCVCYFQHDDIMKSIEDNSALKENEKVAAREHALVDTSLDADE